MVAGVDEFIFRRGRFSPVIHLTTSTKSHFAKGRQMVIAIILIPLQGRPTHPPDTQGPLPAWPHTMWSMAPAAALSSVQWVNPSSGGARTA